MPPIHLSPTRVFRTLLLAGVAAVALSACAVNNASVGGADYSGMSRAQTQATLAQLSARYQSNPRDNRVAMQFAAALRAAGQPGQAVAVLQQSLTYTSNDPTLSIAYAKALAADGSFDQALNVINDNIRPEAPDWNALVVKGAIYDQMGRNEEARALYSQALLIAPQQPSIEANLGLSFAMSNDLTQAEAHLRRAVAMPGATSQIRQNLALILGLQGRFDEAQAIYQAELPADQVQANMAYIRALLTQQNRWNVIKSDTTGTANN